MLRTLQHGVEKTVFGGATFCALAGSAPPLLAVYHAAQLLLPRRAFAAFDRAFYAAYQHMVLCFQIDLSCTRVGSSRGAPC